MFWGFKISENTLHKWSSWGIGQWVSFEQTGESSDDQHLIFSYRTETETKMGATNRTVCKP